MNTDIAIRASASLNSTASSRLSESSGFSFFFFVRPPGVKNPPGVMCQEGGDMKGWGEGVLEGMSEDEI